MLIAKKIEILVKYLDFQEVFSEKKALVLPEITNLNQHAIKLQKSQWLSYGLIYSLGPVRLKTLKTYIKTSLANGFICLLKSLAYALIFFI